METKKCTMCGEVKPLDEFYASRQTSDTYSSCKACESERARARTKTKGDKDALSKLRSEIMTGRKITWGDKISKTLKEYEQTLEHKANIIKGLESEEVRDLMAEKKIDVDQSEEHRRKIGEVFAGKPLSAEHANKIGEARKGKRFAPVSIEGVEYDSMRIAARALDMNYYKVVSRIKNPRFTEWVKL